MIPLKDYNPTSSAPVITLLLIAACVAVFVLVQPGHGGSVASADARQQQIDDLRFTLDHAAIPAELTSGHALTNDKVDATFGAGASTVLFSAFCVNTIDKVASMIAPANASPNDSPNDPPAEFTPAASLTRSSSIGESV